MHYFFLNCVFFSGPPRLCVHVKQCHRPCSLKVQRRIFQVSEVVGPTWLEQMLYPLYPLPRAGNFAAQNITVVLTYTVLGHWGCLLCLIIAVTMDINHLESCFKQLDFYLKQYFYIIIGLTVTFIEFSVRHAWVVPPLATFNISITEPFSRSV